MMLSSATRIYEDLTNAQRVAHQLPGNGTIDVADEFKALLMSAQGQGANCFFNIFPGLEFDEVQVQHASLDL